MEVGHGTRDAVDVSVTNCGRSISIDAPQAPIDLQRESLEKGDFKGTVVTDMPAEWTMSPLNPRLMTGKAIATMPNGDTASARVTLKMTDSQAPDIEGCFDEERKTVLKKDIGHQVVSEVLLAGNRSLPSGYETGDYITPTQSGSSDDVRVHLSRSNEIVPLRPESVSLEKLCAGTGWLEPPRWILNYKITIAADATHVFAQKIVIETAEIVAQQEGVADGRGPEALRSAMEQANSKLSTPPGDFSAGAD